ncbi:MAG: DNA repair protein [Ruminococcaceae bacterium]|nr:DNA repair protein [Oscillospiraceae bacterium]
MKTYFCIDLKSFYASVECVERGLDPMKTNLVVADPERSEKTICLAVSPSMKALGVKNRCRAFEIPKGIEYITAPPRMQKYIDYAAKIYGVYLNYISKDDIYVYSIDEVFIDATEYLGYYRLTAKEMALMLMNKVLENVGVRAACGIGTNLYLCKIALDITAKHSEDFIGILDEESYRRTLWDHQPLTDFWRIGHGTEKKLNEHGLFTMRDIAQADEETLYRIFGIDAELIIDHARGIEPTTIADIKAYKPKTNCISVGQVLMRDYTCDEGRLIIREMMDLLCLDMVDRDIVTASVTLQIGYSNALHVPPAKGTVSFKTETNSDKIIIPEAVELYNRITDKDKLIRRVNITCNNTVPDTGNRQMSFFDTDPEGDEKNKKLQKAIISMRKKYGKNSMLKGMNLEAAGTTIERNRQIGGHKSGV